MFSVMLDAVYRIDTLKYPNDVNDTLRVSRTRSWDAVFVDLYHPTHGKRGFHRAISQLLNHPFNLGIQPAIHYQTHHSHRSTPRTTKSQTPSYTIPCQTQSAESTPFPHTLQAGCVVTLRIVSARGSEGGGCGGPVRWWMPGGEDRIEAGRLRARTPLGALVLRAGPFFGAGILVCRRRAAQAAAGFCRAC